MYEGGDELDNDADAVRSRAVNLRMSIERLEQKLGTGHEPDWLDLLSQFSVISSQMHNIHSDIKPVFEHSVFRPCKPLPISEHIPTFFLRTRFLPEIEEEETKLAEISTEKYNQDTRELETKIFAYRETCEAIERYVDQKSRELLKEVSVMRQNSTDTSNLVDSSAAQQWSDMLS